MIIVLFLNKMKKYYFLLFLLFSAIYTESYDDCHTTTPVNSVEECLSRVSEHMKKANVKCCFLEGTKDDTPYKECRILYDWDNIDDLISREEEGSQVDVESYKCDPKSESEPGSQSQSRSDSNYLHIGILSFLFLI